MLDQSQTSYRSVWGTVITRAFQQVSSAVGKTCDNIRRENGVITGPLTIQRYCLAVE